MIYHVYSLSDPRKPDVPVYIGCSHDLWNRIQHHTRNPNSQQTLLWFRALKADGLFPCVHVLSSHADANQAAIAESDAIKANAPKGLLNFHAVASPSAKRNGAPLSIVNPPNLTREGSMAKIEADAIMETLRLCGWNKLATAKRLGIGRQTLYNKLKRYGIAYLDRATP